MSDLRFHLRHAVRSLAKAPAHALLAALVLALGVGVNTAMFTLINAAFLRPLPVQEPDRLVEVGNNAVSGPVFRELSQAQTPLAQVAVSRRHRAQLEVEDGLQPVSIGMVSGGYFDLLGLRPALGRLITPEDDRAGEPVLVLSHHLWSSRYGADPGILGRRVVLDGTPFHVVGVGPEGFRGHEPFNPLDYWTPLGLVRTAFKEPGMDLDSRNVWWLHLIGRLRPGATVAQAQEALHALEPSLFPGESSNRGPRWAVQPLRPLGGHRYAEGRYLLMGLQGLVLLVLLIACANVAGLQISRALAQAKETAVRQALGASLRHLSLQLLLESGLLCLAGAALGLLLVGLSLSRLGDLVHLADGQLVATLSLDGRVLAFTALLAALCAFATGLLPLWQLRRLDLVTELKEVDAGHQRRAGRLRRALVASQVAFSLTLLVACALFLKSLRYAEDLPLGFRKTGALFVPIDVNRAPASEEDTGVAHAEDLRRRLAGLPGVSSASYVSHLPLSNTYRGIGGHLPDNPQTFPTAEVIVGPGFTKALGVRLVKGRDFEARDVPKGTGTVLVNEAFARLHCPADPIGQQVYLSDARFTIVGVVEDGRWDQLDRAPEPTCFCIAGQVPLTNRPTFVLETGGSATALAAPLRQILRDTPGTAATAPLETIQAHLEGTFATTRAVVHILATLGVLALLLALAGLFGLASHQVLQRHREIGIRMAMGAQLRQVVLLMLRQGLGPVLWGLAGGGLLSTALGRIVASQLYGVAAHDPAAFAGAGALLSLTALLAICLPALRAARVDPSVALRAE